MDRHSRSPDQLDGRRYGRRRRHSRSRSRSRDRRRRYSRSLSRERIYRRGPPSPDSYRDNCDQNYDDRDRYNRRDRRDRDRYNFRGRASSESSNDSYSNEHVNYRNQTPSNKIIVLGLAKHLTEADINADLHMCGIQPQSIRLIRKRKTGTSRGFAFVEFNTEEEATRWMEYKQGVLMIQDQYRAIMQYSVSKESSGHDKILTDWYCAKCGVFNFKRRDNCFKCSASREESEKGGEGSDEVSNILTKKIMLRNLDVLTNEEGVLTSMQDVIPTLVSKISKILICRDPLTSTSRGICYLFFDNLVDSMNTHNALKSLEPPLNIDNREIIITYCVDSDNRQIHSRQNSGKSHLDSMQSSKSQYTLADVPRLAEYSASVYAKNAAEQEHYYKYYTDYYTEQINSGQYSNIPTISQIGETANSGAAVALSAIQRKQHKQYEKISQAQSVAAAALQIPNGQDNRKYPTPDSTQYQYDDTSGYYYDPTTGLYYDANSQYYYNSEIAKYLYWDQDSQTYVLASQSDAGANNTDSMSACYGDKSALNSTTAAVASSNGSNAQATDGNEDNSKDSDSKRNDPKQDKVKVAKKIVKDMERWAKQLNQKKENAFQPMQAIEEPIVQPSSSRQAPLQRIGNGYADVGFTIMENRETRMKPSLDAGAGKALNKLLPYASDSDNEADQSGPNGNGGSLSEKDLVDFSKLTCLLCKRAFQSLEILNKHLKMSNLHKENLQKLNLNAQNERASGNGMAYRDRAKERRLKYGEVDPPPPNRSRERFEKEIRKQTAQMQKQTTSNLANVPIDQSNVGNRLLQKMGWSEGQGLGKSNQGRTNIIEAESRARSAGLGSKSTSFVPGDDYRSYIKRMMKQRYEQSD
ncbi:RNA-binding protein 5-like [Contarinia nasturtii]|uniref:RNA-binding protein 5-like n=1 Tax=Contarinia nasturtii TaxID=265458 RepID=UPI0012D41C9B|nr:RNA-binding protein 5-like [Contarinia nasturtii]